MRDWLGVRRAVACAVVASVLLAPAAPAAALTERQIREGLYEKVNTARKSRDLPTLRRNDKTQYWARNHANWISKHCPDDVPRWCHDDLGAVLDREFPTGTDLVGENLAMHTTDGSIVRRIHRVLMDSVPHKANILGPAWTHMGFGVIKRNGRVWVVERFLKR